MFKSQSGFTHSFFGSFAYDPIISRHQDHLLVRMNRLGTDRFENIFYRILEEAERFGIVISSQRIIDATDVQANVDRARCAKGKKDNNDKTFINRGTSDPDASFGNKGKGRKKWYGFKNSSNLDPESELIMAVETTSASVPDSESLIPMIDKERDFRGEDAIRKQGGDKGYVGKTEALKQRNILDYIIPRDNMRDDKNKKDRNTHYLHLKHLRYKIERKQSEAKNPHRLRKARYRGRWKVHLQGLLTYMVINLKRITNVLLPITT